MKRQNKIVDPIVRFFTFVQESENGCWIWTGTHQQGLMKGRYQKLPYGMFSVRRKTFIAHRWAYQHIGGNEIPARLQLDHLCRNPGCVNPAHLEAVTAKENGRRGTGPQAINAKKVVCIRGHQFTEENTYVLNNKRYCRACHREKEARRQARLRQNKVAEV